METVYVILHNWQCDSGECGTECAGVFYSLEEAQKRFKRLMEDAKQDFRDLTTEESEYEENDMSWSIWEEGEYCYNHIDLIIVQKEIEDA